MSGTKQTAVKTSEGKAPREVLGSAPRQPQPKFKIKVNKIGKGKTGSGRRFKSGSKSSYIRESLHIEIDWGSFLGQALKSLKRYGTATAPPISESSFSQLVNDILSECGTTKNGTPYGIQQSALQTLKKAVEDTIVLEMRCKFTSLLH